jgi:hypothetical protein
MQVDIFKCVTALENRKKKNPIPQEYDTLRADIQQLFAEGAD